MTAPVFRDKVYENRCHQLVLQFDEVIAYEIFNQCIGNNAAGLVALSFTDKRFFTWITAWGDKIDLKEHCPQLTIINSKTFKFTIYTELVINKLVLLKHYQNMVPRVENNEGVTLMTVFSTIDFLEVTARANRKGMIVKSENPNLISNFYESHPANLHLILITNNVFKETVSKSFSEQCEFVNEMGCEVPNFLDYAELCVFQRIFNDRCLYPQGVFGRSLTRSGDGRVIVGESSSMQLIVNESSEAAFPNIGMGGRVVFKAPPSWFARFFSL